MEMDDRIIGGFAILSFKIFTVPLNHGIADRALQKATRNHIKDALRATPLSKKEFFIGLKTFVFEKYPPTKENEMLLTYTITYCNKKIDYINYNFNLSFFSRAAITIITLLISFGSFGVAYYNYSANKDKTKEINIERESLKGRIKNLEERDIVNTQILSRILKERWSLEKTKSSEQNK